MVDGLPDKLGDQFAADIEHRPSQAVSGPSFGLRVARGVCREHEKGRLARGLPRS